MTTTAFRLTLAAVFTLALQTPVAFAQSSVSVAEQLHGQALSSFRQARFPEAYGRFIMLADAGHAPSARMALWMYQNGPSVFGKDWDSSQEQLTAWAQLAGEPAPTMVARHYPKTVSKVSGQTR